MVQLLAHSMFQLNLTEYGSLTTDLYRNEMITFTLLLPNTYMYIINWYTDVSGVKWMLQ